VVIPESVDNCAFKRTAVEYEASKRRPSYKRQYDNLQDNNLGSARVGPEALRRGEARSWQPLDHARSLRTASKLREAPRGFNLHHRSDNADRDAPWPRSPQF